MGDLTHYVRTGDFVVSLFRNARNVNEYAFAIGALSHYVGDSIGHADAINPATAIEYPKLARKYGAIVTYQDDRHAFVATEFSFDVDQISYHRFAPDLARQQWLEWIDNSLQNCRAERAQKLLQRIATLPGIVQAVARASAGMCGPSAPT